ncbi:MAG: GGDEF domain-containing protein [Hydrogenophaga sp.]|uniref:GGDEF domain-containing protein n=1 Tax=Hydrogenophaga sp. TaxID=1904254 RepID=UPI002715A08D|nr:GGDEF domain-containing protein [Hydrogenophaga sp.]MDO9483112.1 GGDEF domain-containing protein [Hydrogenophaga sp.]MDP3344044.1 GGDEF domain-containing protein [Hydrogenophaga sp.]MDP3806690.1 GGDEF domain-containing protein [Hydrogenophaga sp.]MDP3925809.1 GGDEF domain-containing protein [Hydrogenophaga sp.]MDZ4239757.1 GGDEF domain-containing protein [Hydrogenophaga sp.]
MRFISSIHVAIGLLLVAFAGGFYTDFKAEQRHDQSVRIQLGLERMLRLNQGLTSAIAMAVLEKNSLRAASYPSLLIELEATMRDVLNQTRAMMLASDVQALNEEQKALRAVETEVFELMRQDRWPEAFGALLASDYGMALKLYEINSEAAVGALTIELTNTIREHNQMRLLTLALRLAAVLLLLWTGWRYSTRLQVELTEQSRLRAALALSNADLENKVQQRTQALKAVNHQLEILSVTDGLTQLANRRRFDAVWTDEWQRALRLGTPLAIIMLDVDHFKAYNDHYGHQQGDACLRRVGEVLLATVRRAGELAARYGGEEFVVVMPGASVAHAMAMAEAIRANIEATGMEHHYSPVAGVVTVSLGVAVKIPTSQDERNSLVQAADAALYQAKHQGRNQAVLFSRHASSDLTLKPKALTDPGTTTASA